MKKKILLILAMSLILVCMLAIGVSAANRSYVSYEIETVDGERMTIYVAEDFDQYQGRMAFSNNVYTVAPEDNEQTYPTLDTLTIKKIDLTNAKLYLWTNDAYSVREYGSNYGGSQIYQTNPSTAANFANVEEINFGKASLIAGCRGWTGLKKIIIPCLKPEGVTDKTVEISSDAFLDCTALADVEFGDDVYFRLNGKQWIFANTAITSMDLSNMLDTYIPSNTFYGATSLVEVTIPDSIQQIYGNCFYGCTALETVNISDDSLLYDIGAQAFRDCSSLVNLNLVDGITTIGNDAFRNTGLTKVRLPASLDTSKCGYNIFYLSTKLVSIDFSALNKGETATFVNIPTRFAEGCDALKYISLPEGVKSIGMNAFAYCDELEAVYMPNSVETLNISGWNDGAFCSSPKLFFVNEPMVVSDDFVMPEKPEIYYMPTSLKSQHTSLSSSSGPFVKCKNLNSVLVFPEGFTSFFTNDNWFKFCGTKDNPLSIVCLGDMTNIVYNSAEFSRSAYISYYLMNKNDVDESSITITNTNSSAKTEGAYVYFCNGGFYYQILGNSKEHTRVDFAQGETHHINNPRATATTNATCTTIAGTTYYCFCGAKTEEEKIADALGHLKSEIVLVVYGGASTFFEKGDTTYLCERCGENHTVEGDASEIFTALGLSATEKAMGSCSVIQGFLINHDAMATYNAHSENDIVGFGLVAGTKRALGENAEVFDNTGAQSTQKAAVANIGARAEKYDIMEMRVSGLDGSAESIGDFADLEIYCCGYWLVQNGESVDSFYANENTITETLSQTTTYNTINS